MAATRASSRIRRPPLPRRTVRHRWLWSPTPLSRDRARPSVTAPVELNSSVHLSDVQVQRLAGMPSRRPDRRAPRRAARPRPRSTTTGRTGYRSRARRGRNRRDRRVGRRRRCSSARAKQGADLVLVHHGLFWAGPPRPLDRAAQAPAAAALRRRHRARRLPPAARRATPSIGNNALLAEAIGCASASRSPRTARDDRRRRARFAGDGIAAGRARRARARR